MAFGADGLQVEIADREDDARLQPGAPHQAPRRADRSLEGAGGLEQSELQQRQQSPREAAHGRRAAAVQLGIARERRAAPRARAGAHPGAGGDAAALVPPPPGRKAGARAGSSAVRLGPR